MTVICMNNMGRPNPLKTSTITELEPALNGDRRFEVVTLQYVTELAKSLGRGSTYTSSYRFNGAVFRVEISDGTLRVKSVRDCEENGLSQHPLFNAAAQHTVHEVDTVAFLNAYRRAQKGRRHSAEEIHEMTAAFGPGATVVNVITGRRTRLPGKRVAR